MNISDKSVQEFRKMMKEDYCQDLTDAEARE